MRSEYISPEVAGRLRRHLTAANRLALDVVAATGWRISDVLALERADVEHAQANNGWLWVTESKTGKRSAKRVKADLLARCAAMAGPRWVFQHRLDPARHRTRQAVWKQVHAAARAMRLEERVAPHSWRKMYAVGLYRRTGDLERVRRALNHSSLQTTLLYATSDVQAAAKAKRKRGHRRAA